MPPRTGKRPLEAIDLTGDDDPPRPAPPARKNPRLSHHGLDLDADEDHLFDDVIDPSQIDASQYDDRAFAQFMLYGVLETKIVGVRFYHGHATVGEMVILRREPANQVQNVQRDQIGHIPRQMAAKLAKYIDNRSLLIEGHIVGRKGEYDCPIVLKLYGTSEPVERLELVSQMSRDRLPLQELRRKEKEERDAQRAALKAAQAAAKGGARAGTSDLQWAAGSSQYAATSSQGTQSLDDIIGESERFNPRNVERMVEQFGAKEQDLAEMPLAAQPQTVAAKLLPYQLQGLQWLLNKESPQLPAPGSTETVQLWRRSTKEANVFTNVATNYSVKNIEPTLASGGILADDMGLGKTVEVISLIMADRELKRPVNPGTSDATLIMSPLSVMSNWSSQIKRHVQPDHELRVLIHHGTRKMPLDPETIQNYDVVVTTYETVMSEYWSKKPKSGQDVPRKSGLFSINWRRIVLDEGHNIRNPASKKAVAAVNLLAQSRWVLTGTPIINSLKDLFSLVKFLRLSGGLDRFELFNSAVIRPVNQGDERASSLLQHLMASVCLRRRKDMPFIDLRLPELSEYVHRIQFQPHEKEKYDALELEAKGTLDTYKDQQKTSGADASQAYRHLLEILLRMRQVCNHWKLCGEERLSSLMDALGKGKTLDLTPENLEALQQMLQLSIDSQEDCPICLEPLHDPVISCCAHVFGYSCIERVIETQHKCPMCRAELPATNVLVQPAKEAAAAPPIDDDATSSKIDALLAILKASVQKPGTKTIIFSQWTSFLDILAPRLDALGYTHTRIDGTMPAIRRDAALESLESNPDCTIMLASLGVGSVGLNLVAANQVVLADSWWAPAIEDQAIDRVHRLGQKKPTTVFRLVMEGSVEENVLRIQEDKRKLMQLAFAEKKGKRGKGRTARLADLERLLG